MITAMTTFRLPRKACVRGKCIADSTAPGWSTT